MDRRAVLASTGALAAACMAGCVGGDGPLSSADDPEGGGSLPDPRATPDSDPDVTDEILRELATGNAAFATDLYRYLAAEDDRNLFFSPYSISVALAMTYAGAAGDTATEMEETLHYTLGDELHESFAGLQHDLVDREAVEDPVDGESVDAFVLRVVNALWGREDFPFLDEFTQTLDDHYGAGLVEADFVDDAEGERERINEWVSDATEEKIDELLPSDSIRSETVFVITNAIYFLASWQSEFDPEDTTDEPFTAIDGDESSVPTMHQHLEAQYAELDGVKAVELPYVGSQVSMVLMLPDEDSFGAFESSLDVDRLFAIVDELQRSQGDLAMPRFDIETTVELRTVLSDLGMPSAFGDADFGRMVEGGGLAVDEVYHDAVVTVDEQGTEAAAATAVSGAVSAPPSWGELRFDRPFVFCIRDRPTDSVLFLGRVTDLDG